VRDRRDPLALAALGLLASGSLLLLLFEFWFTRLLGVLALFAFVACGVFAIATPALLGENGKEGDDELQAAEGDR
jgi:hypothetical protein